MIEIGSRARSGSTRREQFVRTVEYIGIDITEGPNVDIVADAHHRSEAIREPVDYVRSVSTFEHFIMSWKVALEINKVLRLGGRVFTHSHQTWPEHDVPFDYFRFSDQAWHGLFNAHTGFRVLETKMGHPVAIAATYNVGGPFEEMEYSPGHAMSVCVAERYRRRWCHGTLRRHYCATSPERISQTLHAGFSGTGWCFTSFLTLLSTRVSSLSYSSPRRAALSLYDRDGASPPAIFDPSRFCNISRIAAGAGRCRSRNSKVQTRTFVIDFPLLWRRNRLCNLRKLKAIAPHIRGHRKAGTTIPSLATSLDGTGIRPATDRRRECKSPVGIDVARVIGEAEGE